jgi:phosphatidate cytidylyltransferase
MTDFFNHLSPFARTTLQLFGGVAGVLLLASAIGALLKWRVARGQPHAVIDNLNARVNAWWVMVAVIGIAFAFGKHGVIGLFLLISFHALREFMTLAYTRRGDHYAIAAAFYLGLPVQYGLIWMGWYGLYTIFIPVYGFLVLPILSAFGGDTKRFLERAAKVQWGLMVCVFCISHVPALLTLDIPGFEGRNLLLIAFLVIVVQGSDVLQYVWGKLLGQRKVAPELSPSKTWEGLIGGVASATALGAALYWATPFNPWQAALISLLICLMGFFGGLVMSAIKRDRGVKDWGHMIEGHGGMLDRLDSVIFAAPVFFHVLHYWWVP